MESEESLHLLHPEQGKNLGFSAVEFLSLILLAACQSPMNGFLLLFQQRREERQKMASRPFAKVSVFLHAHNKVGSSHCKWASSIFAPFHVEC